MELKLENNLTHQMLPVKGVAAVVENPILKHQLSIGAIHDVREKAGLLPKAEKQRVSHYMLPEKVKALPHYRLLDIKMETGT